MSSTIDLSKLQAPTVIEPLDYEQIFEERKAALIALYPESQRAELAAILVLESEPMVILLQENAYRELLLRQRINEAAKAVMLAYAQGRDLDHLADWRPKTTAYYKKSPWRRRISRRWI